MTDPRVEVLERAIATLKEALVVLSGKLHEEQDKARKERSDA